MRYQDIETGEILTEEEFNALPDFDDGQETSFSQTSQPQRLSFLQRAKLSFGGPEQIAQLKQSEEATGRRGVLDTGDIADIAGTILPTAGAVLGGIAASPTALFSGPVGPAVGAGIGATAGEAVRRFGGQLLGVRPTVTPAQEAIQPIIEGATTAVFAKGAQLVGKYVANRFPKVLGMLTGETEVVQAALKNPQAADLAINQGDEALRNTVQEAGKKSIELRSSFIKGHSEAIRDNVFKGVQVSRGYGQATKQDVVKKFYGFLRANNVKWANGQLDFSTSKIKANPGEISKINAASESILGWKNWSQQGTHELKQLIGSLTKFPTEAGGTSKSPFLGKMYHYLDLKVKEALPSARRELYSQANKSFEQNIDLFDDLVEAFNRGDPFTKVAQTFGKNKDSLRMILNYYEKKTGIDIPAMVAGRELAAERSAAFGFLNPREWIDIFISPRVQARGVTFAGKTIEKGHRIFPEGFRTGARSGVSSFTRRLFED